MPALMALVTHAANRLWIILQFNFPSDHVVQRRQRGFHGFPDQRGCNVLGVVAINAAGAGHIFPRYLWMPRLEFIRKAPRRCRNNLEASRDGL